MYLNVDFANAEKEDLVKYLERYWDKDFKMSPDYIGKILIQKTRKCSKQFVPLLGLFESESGKTETIWAPFKMCWYNRELFKDNEYKTKLQPIGKYWPICHERAWYNDDFEFNVRQGDMLIVDDPMEAIEICDRLNELKIDLQ